MYIEVRGHGPDLVLIHGWSMHSAVWHSLADMLAEQFTLHLVDLPGHGRSEYRDGDLILETIISQLLMQLPQQAYWLGWSLGGLLSLAVADRYPTRIKKLVLLAATPCFVQTDGWTCAMEAEVFRNFAENLQQDQSETLKKFLFLQARGAQYSRETIKQLGHQLAVERPPVPQALQAGLSLLIETDLRQQFAALTCPVKMILGDRDTLIPADMLTSAKQLNEYVQTHLLSGAGHAPFIAQADECQREISLFLNEQ